MTADVKQLSPSIFYFPTMACSGNPLCKKSNCDMIQKSRTSSYYQTRWFRREWYGAINANDGYSCYRIEVTGCDARKLAYKTEYYNEPRSAICNQNISPYVMIHAGTRGNIEFSTDSFFNKCSRE